MLQFGRISATSGKLLIPPITLPHTVFDAGGNKYRVITVIQYQLGLVLVKHVLTHVEYDRGGWK
jgi:hypothetical protein